nr:MAG TPA: major capsid protein [Caudoviricetes sp.]
MALTAKQIYAIVNEVAQQAMGAKAIAVIDNTGLIALGNTVLGSNDTVNNFINALTDRIGRTIVSFRAYHSHFPDFERDSIEWGNILQKVKVGMPDAEEDQSYNLVDGTSVDQYKINKAKVNQLLFTTETPWQTHITVHLDELEKAFIDSTSMGTFISGMFGEVQNRIELALENLSMDCVNNYIAEIYSRREVAGSKNRTFKLLTLYNDATGVDHTTEPLKALDDEEFLKFTVRLINRISSTMEYMTTGRFNTPANDGDSTNTGVYTRHTPKSEQKMMLFIDLVNALKTNINSKAFNMEQVAIDIPFMTVPFWQAIDSPAGIHINKTASKAVDTVPNVMGILYDREAMGTYKKQYKSLTSPVNAAGRYYNVFYHMRTIFFNDLTENAVIFVLE